MGTRNAFGVEPPVIARGKFEGKFIVLEIILSYINMDSIFINIVESTAVAFYLFSASLPADIAAFNQFFFYLD